MVPDANSAAYMKTYLKYALEFERYVYIWKNALRDTDKSIANLRSQRAELEAAHQTAVYSLSTLDSRYKDEVRKERLSVLRSQLIAIIAALAFVIFFSLLVCLFTEKRNIFVELIMKVLPADSPEDFAPIGLPGSGVSFAVFVWQTVKAIKIRKKLSAQRKNNTLGKMEENLRLKQKQAQGGRTYTMESESRALAQRNDIVSQFRKAQKALSDIYSVNVLPQKYRNFEAVATLYEYLVTGRCTAIKGHGGIYDTYENDYRSGLIIAKLSEIQNSLERISEYQQLLYSEVKKANITLSSMRQSLASIELSNREIAQNTAISATANQQSAAALNWMMWNR